VSNGDHCHGPQRAALSGLWAIPSTESGPQSLLVTYNLSSLALTPGEPTPYVCMYVSMVCGMYVGMFWVRRESTQKVAECAGNPSGIPGSTMELATGRALDCAQGTTSAGHLARRRAGGERDASWRMRVAAVAGCEAADRVANSAAPRGATPRPLDATLACHRRPTSTRRRPTTVSNHHQQCRPERGVVSTARPSAERLQSIPARPRMRWGWTPRDCEGAHRECCVRMWS
jgi:hypothetical protein